MYFHEMAPYYNKDDWTDLEICVLCMYALCLKQLDRLEDYVRISLKLIAKMIKRGRQFMRYGRENINSSHEEVILGQRATPTQLGSVIDVSKGLKKSVSTPMKEYFDQVHVNPFLEHFALKDGFQLKLHLQPLMSDGLQIDQIKMRIVTVGEKAHNEIWLASDSPMLLQPKQAKIALTASVCTHVPSQMDSLS